MVLAEELASLGGAYLGVQLAYLPILLAGLWQANVFKWMDNLVATLIVYALARTACRKAYRPWLLLGLLLAWLPLYNIAMFSTMPGLHWSFALIPACYIVCCWFGATYLTLHFSRTVRSLNDEQEGF